MKRMLLCAAAMSLTTQAFAGGRLEQVDIVGNLGGGFALVEVVPIFWDERCASIEYTQDAIPANLGLGAFEIPVATLVAEQQAGFDSWNDIPTSFIEMNITDTRVIGNGLRTFDFINELTWETPAGSGFLASSPSVSLIDEATFVVGDDIDGDTDSDVFDPVAEGRDTCFDADGDGDIEFPAGDYAAGTVLDNDVQYNDNLLFANIIWGVGPSSTPPAGIRETDIQAVAVHEFGHSHSLSHSMINQISDTDGGGSTMFPFIDIDDAGSEASQRTLHTDDIAWSSFSYPEGSSASGIAALQAGDVPFASAFDVINGALSQGGLGVLGGDILATHKTTGETLSEGYSGFAQLAFRLSDGALFFLDGVGGEIIDGDFEIPIPRGVYDLTIQALDGDPAAAGNISLTAQVGAGLGQQMFAEEGRGNGNRESNLEDKPGFSVPVASANPQSVNIITNDDIVLRNAGALDFIGTGAAIGVSDVIYAERFANADVLALLNNGAVATTGLFRTGIFDASTVGVFKRASIILGTANMDGTASIDLNADLDDVNEFVGQDGDLTPFYFKIPKNLSNKLKRALKKNPGMDVFLVLEAKNNPNVGDSGLPPLLGLSTLTATGDSYLSVDGGPFNQRTTSNWAVEMRFTPDN